MRKFRNCTGLSLLVVDDDKLMLKFCKIHFGNLFHSVITVSSAKDALNILNSHDIDLVLSANDYHDNQGIWLAKQIRKYCNGVSVILSVSKKANDETIKKIIDVSDGYFKTPLNDPNALANLKNQVMLGVNKRNDFIKNQDIQSDQEIKSA